VAVEYLDMHVLGSDVTRNTPILQECARMNLPVRQLLNLPADRMMQADASSPSSACQLDEAILHDLLNPMTAVLGHLELLDDHLANVIGEADRRRLAECFSSARDLADLLINLRCLAQIRTQSLPARQTIVCVRSLLQSVCVQHQWPTGWTVTADCGDQSPHVRDQAGMLARALLVLTQAAMRLSPARKVLLQAQLTPGGFVQLICAYTGASLDEQISRHLFTGQLALLQRQSGQRIDRARGMELVDGVMQLLDGAAWYEPTIDGGRFVLELLQADRPDPSTQAGP
jgi:K+-sensing histidine kinase KdpD